MKKALLILAFLAVCGIVHAEDVLTHQIRFKKLIFKCQDGTEEVVDASATGGNTYEHTCKDGKWTNTFTNYDGLIQLTPTEYETTDSKEIATIKTEKVEEFIYQKNNPPAYVEPTKEDLESMRASLLDQVAQTEEQLTSKLTSVEIAEMKAEYEAKASALTTKIVAEPIEEEISK